MKRNALFLLALLIATPVFADVSVPLNVEEEDGSPSAFPYKVKITNGSLTDNGDGTVSLSTGGSGEINTASNVGTGVGVWKEKNLVDLRFKSLVSGDNIVITQDANSVRISVPTATLVDGSDATSFVLIADDATGNVALKTDAGITYNASTGALSATSLTEGANAVFNSTEVPGGELGGTWASPTIDDSLTVATWTLDTPTLTTPRFADFGYIADSNGNEHILFDQATSAVNYVQVSNDATGRYPRIGGDGSDTNVGLVLGSKGAGVISTDHAFVNRIVPLTDAATIATDASLGNIFTVTLGGNRTLGTPTNPTDGQKAVWIISQDATGSRTLAFSNSFSFGSDVTSPTLSTTSGRNDYIAAIYRIKGVTASKQSWDVVAVAKGYVG